MRKILLCIVFIFYTAPVLSFSLTDKLLYDNYDSCLSHKLKDVDKSKTNIQFAKQAFSEDCRKAFCNDKIKVTEDEYNLCLNANNIACNKYLEKYKEGAVFQEYKPSYLCNGIESRCREEKYKDKTCGPQKV